MAPVLASQRIYAAQLQTVSFRFLAFDSYISNIFNPSSKRGMRRVRCEWRSTDLSLTHR
jgi:hypothetical protein